MQIHAIKTLGSDNETPDYVKKYRIYYFDFILKYYRPTIGPANKMKVRMDLIPVLAEHLIGLFITSTIFGLYNGK